MKIHTVIAKTLSASSVETVESRIQKVSALYIRHGIITDANLKKIHVDLNLKGASGVIPIVSADLYSLMQFADLTAGTGYQKEANSWARIPLGLYTRREDENFELKVSAGAELLTSMFTLVQDTDEGIPLRYMGYESVINCGSPRLLQAIAFGASGTTFQVAGKDGCAITFDEGQLIAYAQGAVEETDGLDFSQIYLDHKAEGQDISISCGSASRILLQERA